MTRTFIHAAGHRLEAQWLGPAPSEMPTLVFLHEGLGSITQWRDFPAQLAAATGCGALVYNRWGHGGSDPLTGPRSIHFMHEEARESLPEVLSAFQIERPILVGHSDGASISLIYAALFPHRPRAMVLMAPHVFVEELSVTSIAQAKQTFLTTDLPERLARHHGANTQRMFEGWNDVWLDLTFRDWNLEGLLPSVVCPTLVLQGEGDEYGTPRQVEAIAAQVSGPVETHLLPACGHTPFRDQREATLSLATRFIREYL